MSNLRLTSRLIQILLHLLLGILLTLLSATRQKNGELLTHSALTRWWHSRLADILGLRITVSGPKPAGAGLLVSNHVSWLDIIAIGALLPTRFLSKAEVRRWPVIGWLSARAGTLFIRRGQGESAGVSEQIGAWLRHGGSLTLFPEGTTTDGQSVKGFFPRLFSAALDAPAPVIPLALRYHENGASDRLAPYTDQQSLWENLLPLLRRDHTRIHMVFCPAIQPEMDSRRAIAEQARSAIIRALHESRHELVLDIPPQSAPAT